MNERVARVSREKYEAALFIVPDVDSEAFGTHE
jgi:hypothetical protein